MKQQLTKQLKNEQQQIARLKNRREELQPAYGEYLGLLNTIEQKNKLIESLEVVIRELPEGEKTEAPVKRKKNSAASAKLSSTVKKEIADYAFELLREYENGLKTKEIAQAVNASFNLSLLSQSIAGIFRQDERFKQEEKSAWKAV